MRILLIESAEALRRLLHAALAKIGHAVDAAADGAVAAALLAGHGYDLVILDLCAPGIDGWTLLQRVSAHGSRPMALVMSDAGAVGDRIRALDQGADDYLTKPFAHAEFQARVRSLLRRRYHVPGPVIRIADLEVDLTTRTARRAGRDLSLTRQEFALLEYLALRQGQIATRAEIIAHLYQAAGRRDANIISVYIGYLRRKLDRQGMVPLLRSRHGVGYGLKARVE